MSTGYRRIARCALAAVAILGLGAALPTIAAAAERCGPHPAAINFSYDTPKPAIDNTKPQPELQRMGQKRDTQDHEGLILGLYAAEMAWQEQPRFRISSNGASACVLVDQINVKFILQKRTIYIVNTWRSGTCPYTAILAHERKHESTDERIFREKAPIAKKRIADALSYASTASVPTSQVETTKQRLAKLIEDTLRKVTEEMVAARTTAQRAVDAGLEYKRVADSCTQFRQPS
jgi:hypothetical protein